MQPGYPIFQKQLHILFFLPHVFCDYIYVRHVFLLNKAIKNLPYRALAPPLEWGNGAGAHGIGKISVVSTKIGKIQRPR